MRWGSQVVEHPPSKFNPSVPQGGEERRWGGGGGGEKGKGRKMGSC
jgi:hypothetical protein